MSSSEARTSFAFRSRIARRARCLGPPSGIACRPSCTSSGPRSRKSTNGLYHTKSVLSAGFFRHLSARCQTRSRLVDDDAGTAEHPKEERMAMASETRFTERQRQVVELIAAGCSNDEIGRRLGISPRTAKAHSDVLRQKLGVTRRRQIPVAYRALTGDDPLARSLESAAADSGG